MSVRVVPGVALGSVVGFLTVAGLVVLPATPAHAHNNVRSTNPTAGSTVATMPVEVELVFDRPATRIGTAVTVTGPKGQVQTGRPVLIDSVVRQRVRAGAEAGRYTVAWRITSVDGHPISGTFRFTAKAARADGSSATDAALPTTGSTEPAGSGTPWAGIVAGAIGGTVAGTVIVLRRRRKARDTA